MTALVAALMCAMTVAGTRTPIARAVTAVVAAPSIGATPTVGDVYVSDLDKKQIVKVPAGGGPQSTVGTGLNDPFGVAIDAAGNVYIGDRGNHRVVKTTPDGTQSTVGTGSMYPYGVAVDNEGNVYIADASGSRVLKVTPDGTQSTVGAGLNTPQGVAVDAAGNVYIADTNHNQVVKVPAGGGAQTTVLDGLNRPPGVAVDLSGNVYIADAGNNRVVKVNPGGNQTTVGTGLNYPAGVAIGTAGDVYIADLLNNRVVKVPGGGGAQTTVGTGINSPGALAVYAPAPVVAPGMLRVTTSPPVPSRISVDGNVADTWGLQWVKQAPGSHEVCFSDVAGFTTPACQTVTVITGATTTVNGAFVRNGYLKVETSPAVPSEITIDGHPANNWGVYTDLVPGVHQVCFGAVAGYDPPACQNATTTAGNTVTTTGTFTPNAAATGQPGMGMLRVTTSPAVPSQISIDGYVANTWGLDWLEISPGTHTVCYSDVAGYSTPECNVVSILAGTTATVQATFTLNGYLKVETAPVLPGTISIDGHSADDWGVYTDLPTGTHQVCFGAVSGHATPACQGVTLTAGVTTKIIGTYT